MDQSQAEPRDPEEQRREVLEMLLSEAAFDGFTETTLKRAARQAGLEEKALADGLLHRLFPRGVQDALAFWSEEEDRRMAESFKALEATPHGVTDKIRWLIKDRIEGLDWNREAARRAASTLALPQHAGTGAKLVWQTADKMWRTIGDTSTDFNWYTKRTSLSVIYGATLSHWFQNDGDAAADDPYAETWAFLDRRLSDLMKFEKAKGKAIKAAPDPAGIVGFLGRLRYGSGK
ncbi:COQ9 family protein [Parvularcula maris]|uniref:COQ9 family protein n=1 Tax=Parvularcula maris TaxID=2965077 RepID=A0A9X2L6W7_9PROT|nr:COQ9 family protein [Parvularcula maris]MCQ8184161.1 COQ9 family protein [Parvularcula maris]